jgi:hypothetical protein
LCFVTALSEAGCPFVALSRGVYVSFCIHVGLVDNRAAMAAVIYVQAVRMRSRTIN